MMDVREKTSLLQGKNKHPKPLITITVEHIHNI